MPKSPPTVFISYAREDLRTAQKLYNDLKRAGANPWLDVESLLPGKRWRVEVKQAIRESRYFLAVLSSNSVSRRGYVHKEVAEALELLGEFPESEIFIIPARLDDCSPSHESLRDLHWVDMFPKWEDGLKKILLAIQVIPEDETVHPDVLERPQPIEPEMVLIPADKFKFLYGQKKKKVTLPDFWIDKTPVTNAEYARFVADTGHKPPRHWKGKVPPKEIDDHPVTYVSWHDAVAYGKWTGKRLPTEEEWEKAAQGSDGREYPWGNQQPTSQLCNFDYNEGGTTPVGRYSPQGDSPYGCVDMAGNVWEWTASDYHKWAKVLRGGSWANGADDVRGAHRNWNDPVSRFSSVGFRCARGSQ
jgi:formylglycine-generating enzyme required for sulfatase activity